MPKPFVQRFEERLNSYETRMQKVETLIGEIDLNDVREAYDKAHKSFTGLQSDYSAACEGFKKQWEALARRTENDITKTLDKLNSANVDFDRRIESHTAMIDRVRKGHDELVNKLTNQIANLHACTRSNQSRLERTEEMLKTCEGILHSEALHDAAVAVERLEAAIAQTQAGTCTSAQSFSDPYQQCLKIGNPYDRNLSLQQRVDRAQEIAGVRSRSAEAFSPASIYEAPVIQRRAASVNSLESRIGQLEHQLRAQMPRRSSHRRCATPRRSLPPASVGFLRKYGMYC